MKLSENTAIEQLDLRSIRLLLELLRGRGLANLAATEGLSQSALSNALKRWRALFKDPLLVRSGRSLTASSLGLSLLEPLALIANQAAELGKSTVVFEPKKSTISLTIGAPDYLAPDFLPSLTALALEQAPKIRLNIRSIAAPLNYAEQLAEGALDVVIANWQQQAPYLRRKTLLDDTVVCLVRNNHPFAQRRPTKSQYLAARHIAPTAISPLASGFIDTALSQMGLQRDIAVRCAYFSTMLSVLEKSSLVLTTGKRYASKACHSHALVQIACPIEFPPMRFSLLWHERSHQSAAHAWLRGLISSLQSDS